MVIISKMLFDHICVDLIDKVDFLNVAGACASAMQDANKSRTFASADFSYKSFINIITFF